MKKAYQNIFQITKIMFTSRVDFWKMGMKLTTNLYRVPRSRMRRAIHPYPQYVFMAWRSVKHRVFLRKLQKVRSELRKVGNIGD